MKKTTPEFTFPIYPILFGLYPVLYLWSANRTQEPAYVIIPSLMTTLVCVTVIYLVNLLVFRNIHRAALLSLLVSFYLVTYGQFLALLRQVLPTLTGPSFLLGSAIIVALLFLMLALFSSPGKQLAKALNLVSAVLILIPVFTAAPYYMTMSAKAHALDETTTPLEINSMTGDSRPRDIYYIVLDNYGRQDVLQNKSDFNNSALVGALKARGFILPECAQSNYFHTAPVISSVLNMDYMDKLGIKDTVYSKRSGYSSMLPLLQSSLVMSKFRSYGYHTVTFRGFMGLMDIQSSDTYINFESDKDYTQRLETSNFNNLYFQTTLLNDLNEAFKIYPDLIVAKGPAFLQKYLPEERPIEDRYYQVYQQNLYSYKALKTIPIEIESPKFIYAHIYSAHWPFLMAPDGSLRLPFSEKMTVEGYVDGISYTNSQIIDAIDAILANSDPDPVIILQGDHSDGWEGKVEWSGIDRLKILSAYYLPDGGDELLYDTISPVNDFRLVFKYYFGEDIDLLPDVWRYLDQATKTVKTAPRSCMPADGSQ